LLRGATPGSDLQRLENAQEVGEKSSYSHLRSEFADLPPCRYNRNNRLWFEPQRHWAVRLGAYDFVTKPFDLDEIVGYCGEERWITPLSTAKLLVCTPRVPKDSVAAAGRLIGTSGPIAGRFHHESVKLPATDSTVLICGESGTGKEVVAQGYPQLQRKKTRTLCGRQLCRAARKLTRDGTSLVTSEVPSLGRLSRKVGRSKWLNRRDYFPGRNWRVVTESPIQAAAPFCRSAPLNEVGWYGNNCGEIFECWLLLIADLEASVREKAVFRRRISPVPTIGDSSPCQL